ncbi:SCO7613 C-terminal domain-containing membrane protein [Cellulomonas sp. URHD0024]|uniref:SCO7613 C-terminal domain-containing membrane protein n=1 Tax=Cellulomonas sp. URHD0024 TaxID=1302620 RepID=UPI0003FFC3EB|nr:hypothetical protein [Cellulomonas sp. URHD0024]
MTEPEIHLTPPMAHARRVLLDTALCPACGSRVVTTTCGTCWLDLSGDAGRQIWQSSLDAVATIEARAELAARFRAAQAVSAPHAAQPTFVPAGPAPAPVPSPAPVPRFAPPSHVPPPRVAKPRVPWRVQTVLQILGVALLAMASLVFLVFSWDVMDVAQRGAVIALGTIVVLGLAVVLERRELHGSAQAVGVLGAVLVVLDAWAVYAIGLVPDADPAVYAAVACLICATLLGAYGVLARIRAGTVSAAVLLPLAPLMLLGTAGSVAGVATLLLAVVAVATLRFVPWARGTNLSAERAVLDVFAFAAMGLAWFTAVVGTLSTSGDDRGAWSCVAVLLSGALVGTLQSVLAALQDRAAGALRASSWAVWVGVSTATAATITSVLAGFDAVLLPAATAVAGVLVVARWPRGLRGRRLAGRCADAATIGTLAVGVPTLGRLVLVGADTVANPAVTSWTLERATGELGGSVALVALLLVVARWRGGHAAPAARHGAAAVTTTLVLVATALVGGGHANAALVVASSAAAVTGLLRVGWLRWYLRVGATVGLVAALVASAGQSWWIGVVLAAGAAVAFSSRWWSRSELARAVSTLATSVLGWGALAQLLTAGDVAEALTVAAATSVAVLTAVALWWARTVPERHVALTVGGIVGGVTWAVAAPLSPAVAGPMVALCAVTVLAELAVAVWGPGRLLAPVVIGATAVAAPTTVLALVTARALTGWPDAVALCLVIVTIGGVAAVIAGALPVRLADRRVPLEVSGWAVVAVGVLASGGYSTSVAALSLVLAALVAGVCSVRLDRRAELWAALGLLVAASWCALVVRDVGVPEAYLAPLGAVLTVVGLVRWRYGGAQAAVLLGSGLALATVPTAVVSDPLVLWGASLDRTLLATAASTVLVLAAHVVVRRRPAPHAADVVDPVLALAAVGGALALLGPTRRAVVLAAQSWPDHQQPAIEAWALPAAALLAGACVAWLLARPGRDPLLRRATPWLVVLVACAPALLARDDGPVGVVRFGVGAALGTYLAARGAARTTLLPGGRGARWTAPPADLFWMGALVLALSTNAALHHESGVPQDAIVVGLGLLALVVGAVRLRAVPETQSWLALGPGLVGALAVPTLTALATGAGWRVGLVIAGGLLAVWVGAARRWQAPFVVGSLALLVQLLVQLAPVTRQAIGGLGWWPILAVGGAALLGLGLTYERRLRDAKEAVRYVAAMS